MRCFSSICEISSTFFSPLQWRQDNGGRFRCARIRRRAHAILYASIRLDLN